MDFDPRPPVFEIKSVKLFPVLIDKLLRFVKLFVHMLVAALGNYNLASCCGVTLALEGAGKCFSNR